MTVLALNSGDTAADVKKHWAARKFYFQGLREGESAISDAYGVSDSPTTIVIGADGKIVAKSDGHETRGLRAVLAKIAPAK